MLLCCCQKDVSGPADLDFTSFQYLDFNSLRLTLPDTTFEANVKTMIIRRLYFKRGTFSLAYDSVLRENVPVCTPLIDLGDTVCPSYYQYFLVDSVWFGGNTTDKFLHRLELKKVLLPDTTILNACQPNTQAMVSEPSIAVLDSLTDKLVYATIAITRQSIPSHDGINYSVDYHGDLITYWPR